MLNTSTIDNLADAWARLLANLADLPEPMQCEVMPLKRTVEQALSAGAVPDTLARQINDISARHMQACMLPVQ